MYVDWKCVKCGEQHLSLIDDVTKDTKDTTVTLKCSKCNTTFLYNILSIKYLVNCLVCDSVNNSITEQTISLWY